MRCKNAVSTKAWQRFASVAEWESLPSGRDNRKLPTENAENTEEMPTEDTEDAENERI
jgi:hypothetical protein